MCLPQPPSVKGSRIFLERETLHPPSGLCALRKAVECAGTQTPKLFYSSPSSSPQGNRVSTVPLGPHIRFQIKGRRHCLYLQTQCFCKLEKQKGFLQPGISNPVEHLKDYEILIRPLSSSQEISLWNPGTEKRRLRTPHLDVVTLLRDSTKTQRPNEQRRAANTDLPA